MQEFHLGLTGVEVPCYFLVKGAPWVAVFGAPEEGRGWESCTHVRQTEPQEGAATLRGQDRFQGARAGVSEEQFIRVDKGKRAG